VIFNSEVMFIPIFVCLAATIALGGILRRSGLSLGLPFAYSALLLLEHIPGAWASAVVGESYSKVDFVKTGVYLTAVGLCAFVGGAWLGRRTLGSGSFAGGPRDLSLRLESVPSAFLIYCLIGGWFLVFAVRAVVDLPSVNAVLEKGGAIWLLAVMVGLATSFKHRSFFRMGLWLTALIAYPSFILVMAGFMSGGSVSVIVALSIFCIVAKRYIAFLLTAIVAAVAGLSLFVSYFAVRPDLREVAWSGAPVSVRATEAADILTSFRLISFDDPAHLDALGQRLNQNYFIGTAAERLGRGQVDFLWGRSVWEGLAAVIPRAIWPDKPVYGGSGDIVVVMTGLDLETTNTAWGVGSVMEFYVNFGVLGVVFGFIALGFVITRLDLLAARRMASGHYGSCIVYFLVGVSLVQPLGSLVELSGGAAAALLAGLAWRWGWMQVNWRRASLGPHASATLDMRRPPSLNGTAGRDRPAPTGNLF
jgi:hypothetical protein